MRTLGLIAALAAVVLALLWWRQQNMKEHGPCAITARDTTMITMLCDGDKATENAPSDLYPKCQVTAVWPACKEK